MKTYPLPIYLQRFFSERLATQLHASPNTVASYRDTFRLLLKYTADRLGRQPTELQIADIDADLVGDFLTFVETRPWQWRAQPQHTAVGDPLVLRICRRQ